MFLDDVVPSSESREEAQTSSENWRQAIEISGMKICRSKTINIVLNKQ